MHPVSDEVWLGTEEGRKRRGDRGGGKGETKAERKLTTGSATVR